MGTVIVLKPEPTAAEVDRCAYLVAKQLEAKPWLDEVTKLKKAVREYCESKPGNLPWRLEGTLYYLDLTPREYERTIVDKLKAFRALRKVMGLLKLIQAITITFKVLDKEIPLASQAKYVTAAHTGSRDISAGLLTQPVAIAVAA